MKEWSVVLVDRDAYTTSILAAELAGRGFASVTSVANALDLPRALGDSNPEAVIFNYHADQPDSLIACSTIRSLTPRAAIIAIASPGPALKAVRAWSAQTNCIDLIVEKPLSYERFFPALDTLLQTRSASRELAAKAEKLSNLVPEGALTAAEKGSGSEAELFEAAVLFTDIRGSSQLIRSMPPRDFFGVLNPLLSAHSKLVTQFDGSVIKYTGDGVMAIFRGMGHTYMALRCALELAATGANKPLPFGTGVAEGLVLAGLIGDSHAAGQRRQYDVIGATVHLSARLCGLAGPGEVVTTKSLNSVVKLQAPLARQIGRVPIKGFEQEVECVAFSAARR
jgi:class 3 adenylate cyclase